MAPEFPQEAIKPSLVGIAGLQGRAGQDFAQRQVIASTRMESAYTRPVHES